MEGELIYVAIIMQLGTIITIAIWSSLSLRKYFLKENFKTGLSNVRAENRIKLKKLERDFGLKESNVSHTEGPPSLISQLGQLSQFAPLIKHLDEDQIGALINKFTGESETVGEDEQGGGISSILDAIPKSVIDSFTAGLKDGGGAGGTQAEPQSQSQVP